MELKEFFAAHPKIALAFSGGVDSAYLLYAAKQLGAEVRAYYVKTAFQPQFELDDAKRLVEALHADMTVLLVDNLSDTRVAANPANRCYFCKKSIFSSILHAASADGFTTLIDGTNASDDAGDRPGMQALRELKVYSPLRDCGLTKADVRRLSKEAGLFTWNKPAYACLATRIPAETPITPEDLARTEKAEDYLSSLGFTDFRVRQMGNAAKLQLPDAQLAHIVEAREQIVTTLKQWYSTVLLDLEVRDE